MKTLVANPIADSIRYYDDFLSEKECAIALEELSESFWQPSLTYTPDENNVYIDILTDFRKSETAQQRWFSKKLERLLAKLEKRLAEIFNFEIDYLEPWQATRYPLQGKFDYHVDAGYWTDHPAGERTLTFLIYLKTPVKGGGTHFRALDKYVDAKAGRLLVWNNLFDNGLANYQMIHSSTPLKKGEKTTLVTWLRQKPFRNT